MATEEVTGYAPGPFGEENQKAEEAFVLGVIRLAEMEQQVEHQREQIFGQKPSAAAY